MVGPVAESIMRQEETLADDKDKHVDAPLEDGLQKLSISFPANWPEEISYLSDQTYSVVVTSEMRSALSRSASNSEDYERVPSHLIQHPNPRVKINIIDAETHPAKGQRGLFAAQHLEPNSFICLYLGHVHTNGLSDMDPHSDYDLNLDRDVGLSIDAVRSGNESRCANDYRGIAERPNAEFRDCFIKVPSEKRNGATKWERRVAIFVLSAGRAGKRKMGIKPDQEILVSYGKAYWEARKTIATFRKDAVMLTIAEAALNV